MSAALPHIHAQAMLAELLGELRKRLIDSLLDGAVIGVEYHGHILIGAKIEGDVELAQLRRMELNLGLRALAITQPLRRLLGKGLTPLGAIRWVSNRCLSALGGRAQ